MYSFPIFIQTRNMLSILLLSIGLTAATNFEELCPAQTLFKDDSCVCFPPGSYELKRCGSPEVEYFTVSTRNCVKVPNAVISRVEKAVKATLNLPRCSVNRPKRAVPPPPPYDQKVFFDKLEDDDEDKKSIGEEVGNPLMIEQINAYVERVIEKLTGINEDTAHKSNAKLPAFRILEYAKQIMVKTCTVVSPDFFDMAFSAFVSLQTEVYQLKEPFIPFTSLKRIEQAMQQCLQAARPHLFYDNKTASTNNSEECYNHLPFESSNYTLLYPGTEREENRSIEIPEYGSSRLNDSAIAEPLIESVWKMLVNAHSYCFKYFQGSFNDHHVFTVALLPMFTNQIQDIWLHAGVAWDDTKIDHETSILYGGLFGDAQRVRRFIGDVDICVGASKAISDYPWFMNRPLRDPTNKWRKKRSAVQVETVAKHDIIEFECVNTHAEACVNK